MDLTKPQIAVLIQYCTSVSNGGVLQGKKPDPRVIRSLIGRGLLVDHGGWYQPSTAGFERVRSLKVRDFKTRIQTHQTGSVSAGVRSIISPRDSEHWILEVADQMDEDLRDYKNATDKTQKIASYYSFSARATTINKYVVGSGRDVLTVLQLRKFFHSREPHIL